MKIKYSALLVLGTSLLLSSCGCSNNPDKNILNDVNEAIAKSENPVNTCYDAVQVALAAGIDLENYQFTDKNYCFAFDIDTKQFVIMNDDNIVYSPRKYKKNKNTYSYFKFTNAYDAKSIYSQYLTSDFAGADLLVATTGLDMGVNRNVKTIMYNNTTGNAKTVHLRMFCDYLNINAVTDTVNLYYAATNVYVTQVKELYECATASSAYVQVSMGDVYFKPNCSIDLFEVPEKANVTTHYEEGANVYG
ncbi:MAG: hypothetical protein MJ208_02915, partial [Bacilli bacterium]|nr:hypothetical protein [Bacilli bacterium]